MRKFTSRLVARAGTERSAMAGIILSTFLGPVNSKNNQS